jgi:hypothetical protein
MSINYEEIERKLEEAMSKETSKSLKRFLNIQDITEKEYYRFMCMGYSPFNGFNFYHKKWYQCFRFILLALNKEYPESVIRDLFYRFEMDNWTDLHLDESIYAGKKSRALLESFMTECQYISDRATYDRLFRTHWLFRKAFEKELEELC